MRPLSEQTILITGATDGLGRALATHLAGTGATLLLHGRDDARGKTTLAQIEQETGNDKLYWYRADLADLEAARSLVEAVKRDHDQLTGLVSNAGIGSRTDGVERREESHDGYELRFAVNYLAGFLIVRGLAELVLASSPARIVQVASAGQAPIDFDDVMLTQDYSGVQAYCQSKLAQIMFTVDLGEAFAGTGVTANALHPATYMPTKIVQSPVSSIEDGVEATGRLITDPALDSVTGRYFNQTTQAQPNPQAHDRDARDRLRDLSEHLTSAAPLPV